MTATMPVTIPDSCPRANFKESIIQVRASKFGN